MVCTRKPDCRAGQISPFEEEISDNYSSWESIYQLFPLCFICTKNLLIQFNSGDFTWISKFYNLNAPSSKLLQLIVYCLLGISPEFHININACITFWIWNLEAKRIVSSAYKKLGLLKHLQFIIGRKNLSKLYTTFIRYVFEYSSVIWDG